jgi:hopanoid biosynthesis associated RND transporter like protein HpnN
MASEPREPGGERSGTPGRPARRSPIRRLLVGLVTLACRFPRTVLAVSLILAAVSLSAAALCLQYQTQRNDLLGPDKESQKRWKHYLAEFGDDDDIVAVVKGHDRRHMRQALDALADKVRSRPDLFDRLFYKVDLRGLRNRALLFLSLDEIRSIQQNIQGMGLLLQFGPLGWRNLTLQSLLAEADQRAAALQPGRPLSAADEQFFTQLLSICRTARDMLADPVRYKNPWSSLMAASHEPGVPATGLDKPGEPATGPAMPRTPQQQDLLAEPQYFFSEDRDAKGGEQKETLAFLLVRPVKEAGSFTAALKPVSVMREYVASLRRAWPDLAFGLTGMPVLETDEMAAADRDTHRASYLAIAGVSLLFVLVYRGLWYPLLTVATLLLGTAWAMGWLTLTVGHLNILSAAFAVMLIGMGDYGVLWVMRYEQARRRGLDVRAALVHTAIHVAVGNLTAATTLALAFFAAIFADFRAVAELGWIAGCGVLLCALACFTVLPALLTLFDRRMQMGNGEWGTGNERQSAGGLLLPFRGAHPHSPFPIPHSPFGDGWMPGLWRHSRWIVAGGLALAVALGVCASRVRYDHNLLHLQPRGLESVQWELTLIEHTAGASWHALSWTATPEEALALKARYEELPEVSRVVEVASLVPAAQADKLPLLEDISRRLRGLPERGVTIPHARPSRKGLLEIVARVAQRLEPAVGSSSLVAQLRASLDQLHGQLRSLPSVRLAEERLQDFEERLAGDLAEDLHRLREVSEPQPITLADLPPDLRERYIGKSGQWLLRVFARESLWDFGPLEHFCRRIRKVDPEATGKPFATVEGLVAMKDGLLRAGLYAFAVIAVVLLIDFRKPKTALLALSPLLLAVLFSVGLLALAGVPLNPANTIAFPLILGVGVDNGVHVLHDYLLRRAEGRPSISRAIGRGVLVKALTTSIGFGMLMISTERGLVGLGLILTLGVGCSMLSALIFLPAVLHLLDRRRRRAPALSQETREVLRRSA